MHTICFREEGKGWCAASELEEGDVLRTQDGRTETVAAVETEILDEPVKVYNLEIEDSHTYFVSADGVLVHNMCTDSSTDVNIDTNISNTVRDGNGNRYNPLEDIVYTDKVKQQMTLGDYHSFPEYVRAFGDMGTISKLKGGDGILRTLIEIKGSYLGKDGVFQFIIEPDGITCNHRLFVP